MEWEVVIGLETHVQLSTKSKIFSGASAAFGAEPNTHACPIDLALPAAFRCSTVRPSKRRSASAWPLTLKSPTVGF